VRLIIGVSRRGFAVVCQASSVSWTIQLACSARIVFLEAHALEATAKQSLTPTTLNSFSATHMFTLPVQRPPRAASSA
jgi:hypothetical protein